MSDALWMALGLMLLFEGVMPLLNPGQWRRVFEQAMKLSDGQLRFVGLCSVLLGLLLLWMSGAD
ncbi:MAG: hypothetical protein RJA98_1619 [Pseudomonadota bacterium]|jgi:uncharacterized protein YjeT (DUF2065 family)